MTVDLAATAPGVHADALERLRASLSTGPQVPLVLLTAPRAGYGKTHLLGRLAAAAPDAVVVPVGFRLGDEISFATAVRRALPVLGQGPGARGGWSRLREACAGVGAKLLHGLIEAGQVPSANPEQAMRVLAESPEEAFDSAGAARMIGDWVRKHVDPLRGPMAALAGKQIAARPGVLDVWLEAMLSQALEGGTAGVVAMTDLAHDSGDEDGAMVWLALLGLWRPVILMVDHLDGFAGTPEAGLRIASLLLDLAAENNTHVVLSLNQDVWQAIFGTHLPSALEDRLTAAQVSLRGLSPQDAEVLVKSRLERAGVDAATAADFSGFLDIHRYFLGRPLGTVSARVLLRHAARQWEIFEHSVASPAEDAPSDASAEDIAAGEDLLPLIAEEPLRPAVGEEPQAGRPILPEAPPASAAGWRDSADTQAEDVMLRQAPPAAAEEGGAESTAAEAADLQAQDQDQDLPAPAGEMPQEANPNPQLPPEPVLAEPMAPSAPVEESAPEAPSAPRPAVPAGTVMPSADAFERLREMLRRLRQPNFARSSVKTLGSAVPGGNSGTQAGTPPETPVQPAPHGTRQTAVLEAAPERDALLGRFEALRMQMQAEADQRPLDYSKLAELIRLAGRRFPLVRFTEHELPGMTGRYAMCWSLQGSEILFGLANFADIPYWRTLTGFAAGRIAEIASLAERVDVSMPKLKLVTFKSDREQAPWQALSDSECIPESLRPHLDPVHLDSGSIASLYAMQRIIKEAESGSLQVEPAHVMSALARELDFFWKRITRLG